MVEKYNRIMEESEGPVLCIEISQPVTLEAYNSMYIPALTKIFLEYGEVRVLYSYTDPENFPGWEPAAAEQDFENLTRHSQHAKKIALVDAPAKVVQRWRVMEPLLGGPVREFKKEQFDEALAWIKA